MGKIFIFGGTTEGRLLAEYCQSVGADAVVSVTTDYGAELLHASEHLEILTGRLDAQAMEQVLSAYQPIAVMDATHPYAVEATRNIQAVCQTLGLRYLRILRDTETEACAEGRYFDSTQAVAAYLLQTKGRILLTTGSKALSDFCITEELRSRCTVRILPNEAMIAACLAKGFSREQIIAEQGPFSLQQNMEHLRQSQAAYLVTKESGSVGGFSEKVAAAKAYGAEVLVIRRPIENGIALDAARTWIKEHGESI